MEPAHDPAGPGEDPDEEGPGAPWLPPPDDRLWRHPSEVRANPAALHRGGSRAVTRLVRFAPWRMWVVGVVSGVTGALLCAGALVATGAVRSPTSVPVSSRPTSVRTVAPTPLAVPSLTALLDMVEPSVVSVTVTGAQGVEAGSGVIVSTGGNESYIVTDGSFFSEAGQNPAVQVATYSGEVRTAAIVGQDPSCGLVLLKALITPVRDVNPVNQGSVADIQTGEPVLSVGSRSAAASANEAEFASGYIDDNSSYLAPENGASDAMFSMLAADLAVGASSYGGAVVDSRGNLLGISTQVQGSPPELTYITPVDTIMADVSAMISGGQPAAHPWLGILQATDMSGDGAPQLGAQGGVEVESIAAGSPVAKKGLVDGDAVTMLNGQGISSVGALIAWLDAAKPGQVVSIGWVHAGRGHRANVTLGTQPAAATQS